MDDRKGRRVTDVTKEQIDTLTEATIDNAATTKLLVEKVESAQSASDLNTVAVDKGIRGRNFLIIGLIFIVLLQAFVSWEAYQTSQALKENSKRNRELLVRINTCLNDITDCAK